MPWTATGAFHVEEFGRVDLDCCTFSTLQIQIGGNCAFYKVFSLSGGLNYSSSPKFPASATGFRVLVLDVEFAEISMSLSGDF